MMSDSVLPDVLKPGLAIVFCGTAAGNESARRRAYYAGLGNAFWPTLAKVGLTPCQLAPEEFWNVITTFLDVKLISYGLLEETVGETRLFVLPSPSGAARGYWNLSHWVDLAKLTREYPA